MRELRSRWNLVALLIAISTMLGCTAMAAGPNHAAQQSQGLVSSNAVVDFGTIVAGNTTALTNYIYNPSSSKITITRVTVSDQDFQVTSRALPIVLYPNQGTRLVISYSPQDSGNSSATLMIASSGPQSSMTVPLSGVAIPAGHLVVSPLSLSFGNVTVGKSQSKSASFTNSGATPVTVSQASVSMSDYTLTGISFPLTLQPHQSSNFAVVFTPKAAGNRNARISVGDTASLVTPNARTGHKVYVAHATSTSETATVSLSGVGAQVKDSDTTLGQLTATPGTLSFGSSQVGSTQTKSVVLSNSGTADITVSQVAATGSGYSITGPNLPVTLGANQTASFTVTFAPQAAGAVNGNIAISSNATNTSLSVGLTGTAVSKGLLSVSASPIAFGTVKIGATQKSSATIKNTGGSNVTVSRAIVSGSAFSMTSMGMPMTLAPNQTMQVSLTCAPKTSGALTGSLSVTSDASNDSLSVPLTGTAVADGALTVTPSSLSFGSVQTGQTQSKSISLTNSGGSTVTISQASFAGSGYSANGLNLPLTLQAGQSASFNVVFAPQTATASNTSLSITSDASNPSLSVAITGSGVTAGSLTAGTASLSFGNVTVGTTRTLQETVTNSGGSSVTLTAIAAGAGYSVTGLNLPTTLTAGQSTSFSVVFAPKSAGNSSVSLAVTNNSSTPTFSIPLSGTGTSQGALTISPVAFGSVQVGSSSTKQAILTNTGGSSVTVSQATLTGAAFTTSGLSTPLTLTAGQSLTFNVVFTPQSSGSAAGSIALSSDAATSPTLALSGTGTAAGQFSVSPGTFSFGSVSVGSSKTLTAVLSATGSSVTVTSASVSSSEFNISGPSLPLTIQPGSTASFTLTFTPQASGSATGNVSFVSNVGSPFTGSLSGSGAAAVQHSVALAWNASTSDAAGYNVYRSTLAAGPFVKLNSAIDTDTTYTDKSVQAGQTYFYVTTALDSDGLESAYSNQVSAAVPAQ